MNQFSQLQGEELEKHLSSFLITHWSVSAISDFIRNEKSFEKKHIFKDYPKQQALSSIIGTVYHRALMAFFTEFKCLGTQMGFDLLSQVAHQELYKIGANKYRPQKDSTIEDMQLEALKCVNILITNFLGEISAYLDEIQEIVAIEQPIVEFVTINDIDIPLPLKAVPDLVFVDKNGELAIFDHKAKKSYTLENDINLRYGNQSVGYVLAVNEWIKKQPEILEKYPKAADGVKKFLFYENKFTQNRDKSRQIKQININVVESRQLFEQILFEGIWRVMEAVQNPDYVYLMNPSDYFEDGEEIMGFWVKTHIEGLEGFPDLEPRQIAILKKKRSAIRSASLTGIPKNVIKAFSQPKDFISLNSEDMENLTPAQRIEHRLATFSYPVKVAHVVEGYSCDTFLVQINAGLKISAIYKYRMDIANALGAEDVRIAQNLLKYQGVTYVAIEVNREKQKGLNLSPADVIEGFKFPIGRDNFENTEYWDITNPSTAHMMISGATGSGKSVTIRTIIEVALKKNVRVSILDPKNEFQSYAGKSDVSVISDLHEIEEFMEYTVMEMDEIFKSKGAMGDGQKHLIIFDEAADCFARQAKQRVNYTEGSRGGVKKNVDREFRTLEQNTLILAQKARSAGIHLVLAAQRFSVKVLSGDAKANFTTRLCLKVMSGIDSKVMLDQEGAEKLKGRGDGLLISPEHSEPLRLQCFFIK